MVAEQSRADQMGDSVCKAPLSKRHYSVHLFLSLWLRDIHEDQEPHSTPAGSTPTHTHMERSYSKIPWLLALASPFSGLFPRILATLSPVLLAKEAFPTKFSRGLWLHAWQISHVKSSSMPLVLHQAFLMSCSAVCCCGKHHGQR